MADQKEISLEQLIAALANQMAQLKIRTDIYTQAQQESRHASRNETIALNNLNQITKEIDSLNEQIRRKMPRDCNWGPKSKGYPIDL